jgi:hypothetical protein
MCGWPEVICFCGIPLFDRKVDKRVLRNFLTVYEGLRAQTHEVIAS